MPKPVRLAHPFTDFLALMSTEAKTESQVACAPALKFFSEWATANPNGTFGEAIDALESGKATGGDMTLASMWARWCLGLHGDDVHPEVRDRFVTIMSNPAGHPMICYHYLKERKANLTEREIGLLRAAIRGRLPNVPDADTI